MPLLTLYMGLTAWDVGDDPYDYGQLANNFKALDEHNHVPGRGRRIPTDGLEDSSVTGLKLAANSVTGPKVLDGSLGGAELADDSIIRRHLGNDAVGGDEIAEGSIEFKHLSNKVSEVGDIKMWYRPNSSIPIPQGWEVMDGRPWSAVPNAWGLTSGNMPNTQNRFPLGASLGGSGAGPNDPPDIGQTGGSMTINLRHTHISNSHTHFVGDHVHSIPEHVHNTPEHNHFIQGDGQHGHTVAGGAYFRTNPHGRFDGNYTFKDINNANHSTSLSHTFIVGRDVAADAVIDQAGSHNHTGATGISGAGTTSGWGGSTGGSGGQTSGNQSNTGMTESLNDGTGSRNAYVGFLFMMRVL